MKLSELHVGAEYILKDDDHPEPTKVRLLSTERVSGSAVGWEEPREPNEPRTYRGTGDVKEEDWDVMVEVVETGEQIPVRCGDLHPVTPR